MNFCCCINPLDGSPPYDGSPTKAIHQNHLALIVIYDIVAFVGLIFVAVCLVFNVVFRNKKSVTRYCIPYLDSPPSLSPFIELSNSPVLI